VGKDSREAVDRYLADRRAPGESARGVIGQIRSRLEAYARVRHRDDLVALFRGPAKKGPAAAPRVKAAVEALRAAPLPWNIALAASGWTLADRPVLESHRTGFDVRTGEGGLEIWVPVEAFVHRAGGRSMDVCDPSPHRLGAL
jgi:hypothetical protein